MLPWETAPERYDALFAEKCDRVLATFAGLSLPTAARYTSPVEGYRVRAEFRVWHSGDDLDYVMFDPAAPRVPVPVRDFPPALAPIRTLMTPLAEALRGDPRLRRKLFQIEFMASTQGEVLLTLIYHRALDDDWEAAARNLGEHFGLSVVGRSRKQKRVLTKDYITDRFAVCGRTYGYRQYEQSFVQPNAPVNQKMLTWAVEQSRDVRGDLLELYCGNGNFSLPLASCHKQVLATELSKIGVRAATENCVANGIDNLSVVRLSAEEVSQAIRGEREFRRLAALPMPLQDYDLRSVFVDPPRAGLDEATLDCVRGFERIVYVSCNPQTLRDNLQALSATHRVDAMALFDQFPYTPHLESGVVLLRR